MRVYFDNAATTPIHPEVFEAMKPYLLEKYGNPSSTHSHGREVRSDIEKARKSVAKLLNAHPSEIFFTSSGTEADNTILQGILETTGIRHIITSPIEHHAVLHTAEHLEKTGKVSLSMVKLDGKGGIDYGHLEELLQNSGPSLVTLMHGNNEIGNLTDLKRVGELCEKHQAFFHTDAVQTVGHYAHDVKEMKIHALAASAHKFNGPKGAGLMYISKEFKVPSLIHGGKQERGMRGGTENVVNIIGLTKALELANEHRAQREAHIRSLKTYLIEQLQERFEGVRFNGMSADPDNSLYTVLNVCLPTHENSGMVLFKLDLAGISASGGSACSSGAVTASHVLKAIDADTSKASVRFSFGKQNSKEEIDFMLEKLSEILESETAVS
ncbi:MAG: cysteine desulfurase [Cytophagales bacterium]|nr:cysteine desulfurase [Cytophagales bacterium]